MGNIILVGVLCAILLLGCTGQPPSISSDPNATAAPKPPVQNTSVAKQPAPTIVAYRALATTLKIASSWSATYSITDSGMPEVSSISQFVKNGSLVRIDMGIPSRQYEIRVYLMGQNASFCSDKGNGWSCNPITREFYENEPIPSDLLYRLGTDLSAQPAMYGVAGDGKMEVAGASADCYSLTGANATIKYCVSAKGVPLYMKYDSTKGKPRRSVISATQVGAATDADFALPAAAK